MDIRIPKYLEQFRCIESRCEDNCCTGWDIDIDIDTFNKYKEISNGEYANDKEATAKEELKEDFKKFLHQNEDAEVDEIDYGRVDLRDNKRCPYLNDKNLCRIQAGLGEDYLSNVCATYPRIMNKINGVVEISLTPSCREAARLILLNKDGIDFVDKTANERVMLNKEFDTKDKNFEKTPSKYFLQLRDLSIQIVKNRNFSLDKRLMILGEFIEAVQNVVDYRKTEKILMLIDKFKKEIKEGYTKIDNNYKNNKSKNIDFQIMLNKELLNNLDVFSEIDSKGYVELTKKVIKGLRLDSDDDFVTCKENYKEIKEDYYDDFIRTHDYIMENFIVNFIYKNLFPFSAPELIIDSYMLLIIRCAFIRFNLIGLAGEAKKLTGDMVVEYIQVYSKTVEHHKTYLYDTVEFMREEDFDNLDTIVKLI